MERTKWTIRETLSVMGYAFGLASIVISAFDNNTYYLVAGGLTMWFAKEVQQ